MSRLPGEKLKKKLFYFLEKVDIFLRVIALCFFGFIALCKFGHRKLVIKVS